MSHTREHMEFLPLLTGSRRSLLGRGKVPIAPKVVFLHIIRNTVLPRRFL